MFIFSVLYTCANVIYIKLTYLLTYLNFLTPLVPEENVWDEQCEMCCVGLADCVMALGFEKMEPGSLTLKVLIFF